MLQDNCPRHGGNTTSISFTQENEAKIATSTSPRCEHLERERERKLPSIVGAMTWRRCTRKGGGSIPPQANGAGGRDNFGEGGGAGGGAQGLERAGVDEVVEWPLHPVPSPYKKEKPLGVDNPI